MAVLCVVAQYNIDDGGISVVVLLLMVVYVLMVKLRYFLPGVFAKKTTEDEGAAAADAGSVV